VPERRSYEGMIPPAVPAPEPVDRRYAALIVAGLATDSDDLRYLLQALGLYDGVGFVEIEERREL